VLVAAGAIEHGCNNNLNLELTLQNWELKDCHSLTVKAIHNKNVTIDNYDN